MYKNTQTCVPENYGVAYFPVLMWFLSINMIKKISIFIHEIGYATLKYFNEFSNLISFLKWKCPTKTLLKSFVLTHLSLTLHKRVLVCCS